VPIEIRRFGVGHRRPDGPPGTTGVAGQPIHSDARGAVAELALARDARIEPHANPNTTWFVVIEGGGWVGVGEERTRVAAGEAVLWPADVPHGAWTEHSEMRAIVVEFAGADDSGLRGILESRAGEATGPPELDTPAERGVGGLVADGRQTRHDPEAGEPA
jgi:quercetin dioxygenase-like cupin family protein